MFVLFINDSIMIIVNGVIGFSQRTSQYDNTLHRWIKTVTSYTFIIVISIVKIAKVIFIMILFCYSFISKKRVIKFLLNNRIINFLVILFNYNGWGKDLLIIKMFRTIGGLKHEKNNSGCTKRTDIDH